MKASNLASVSLVVLVAWVGCLTGTSRANPIRVLALDTTQYDWDSAVFGALTGVACTRVYPAGFSSVDLSAYDVLYVGSAFDDLGSVTVPSQQALDALNARKTDIACFVAAGGGVVALTEPIGTGRYTWLPVQIDSVYKLVSGYVPDEVDIVRPHHRVMSWLTDEGLSEWNNSGHTYFTDTDSLRVLVTTMSDEPVTLAGRYGLGRLVVTGQDPDIHYSSWGTRPDIQQAQFIQNSIYWTAREKPVSIGEPVCVPVPGAILLGTIGVGLAGWFRRRRSL